MLKTIIKHIFISLVLLSLLLFCGLAYADTVDITPNAVGVTDNTGDSLNDIISDNGPVNPPGAVTSGDGCYTVGKMKEMYLDGFNVSSIPTRSKITNAVLHLQYGSVNGYYGTAPVNWALHGGNLNSTLIVPGDTGGAAWSADKTFNVFDQGVTTAAQLETMDLEFYNNANTTPKEMSFDYIWITVTYTPPPPNPTINAVSTPTNNKTQVLTGQKSSETTAVYVYCASANVGSVSYPTSTSWQVTLTNLSEGNNAISANAENSGAFSLYNTANIFVDSIAPNKPTINAVSSPTKNTTQLLAGEKSSDTTTINIICSTASFNAATYPTSTTWQVTLNNLTEGVNFISVNAQDAYYNQSSYVTTSISIDNTPPATPTITSLPISLNVTSATVSGTAETNSLVSVYVSNNFYASTNATGGVYSIAVTGLSQGATIIKVTAADALNNISGTASSTVFVDTIAPATPSITTNGGSDFATQDATVTLSGTCAADTKIILVNNSTTNVTFTAYTTSWTYLAMLSAGTNNYNVVALDVVDNRSGTASIVVSRDTNVPADPVINTVSTPTNNKLQLITGTMADNTTTINVMCNTATVGAVSYPTGTNWRVTISAMAEGNNRITVNAQNSYGYSNDMYTIIFVDTTPPNTPNINSLPASINQTAIAVTGTAEANSLVSVYRGTTLVGTANATGGNYAVTASGLVEGYNNIYVTAKDTVNNLSPTAASFVYVDLTPPPTPTAVNLPASINLTDYDIEGTAETGSLVKIYVGGTLKATANVNGGGTYIINVPSLAEGNNSVKVVAQDIYGNNSPSLSSTIYVDTIKPATPSITTNGGNNFTTTNFSIVLQGTVDTDCHEVRVNGSTAGVSYTPGSTNWSFTVDLNIGINNYSVVAEDSVNNQSGADSISVSLNLVYPDVNITPNAKNAGDTTGEQLADIIADDAAISPPDGVTVGDNVYTVRKTQTLYFDGFGISSIPTGAYLTAVTIYLQYGTGSSYDGSNSVEWSYTGTTFNSTGIVPINTGGGWSLEKTSDLLAQGVTNSSQVQNLKIRFINNDSGNNDSLSFDYLYLRVSYKPLPTVSINAVSTPTNNKAQLITGSKSAYTTTVSVQCLTASVNTVIYPTILSWAVTLNNLGEGNNPITVNATNESGTANATTNIFVDSIPPATPTINAVSSPTKNTTQVLTGQKSSDTVTINIICSTASFNAATYPTSTSWQVTLNLSEGTNLISVNAQDAYFNQSAYVTTSIVVDNTPPATPSITSLPISINVNSATVSGTAEVNSLITIYVSGNFNSTQNATGGVFSQALTGLSQGITLIEVTATDVLGNISGTASSTIFVDTIAPATPNITTNGGSDFATQDATVTLSGTCSADTKIILVNNSTTNVTFISYTTTWSYLAALSAGTNNYNVVALDILNNRSGTASIVVSRDTNVPADPIINAVSTPTNNKIQLITGTMAVNTTTINVTCNTATVGTVSYPSGTSWQVTISVMAEGNNRITVNAQNSFGYSNDVYTIIFVDTIPPNTPNINSLPASINQTAIAVTGTAEVNSLVSVYRGATFVGTANATGGNYAVTVSGLVEGYNTINVTAMDSLTNLSATASSIVYVDLTPPNTPNFTNLPASINATTYEVQGTAEAGSLVRVYRGTTLAGTGNATAGSFSVTVSSLVQGINSINATAQDIYGNIGPTVSSQIFVDTIPPVAPVITTNGGNDFTTINTLVTINGTTVTDSVTIKVNGSTANVTYISGTTTWNYLATLAAGPNQISVTALDLYGNVSSPDVINITLQVDDEIVNIVPNVKGTTDNTTETLIDIVSDDASIAPPAAVGLTDNVYTVIKGAKLFFDGFDTSAIPTGALLTSAVLHAQFGSETGYTGTDWVNYAKDGQILINSDIRPGDTGGAWAAAQSFDLYAQGVTTAADFKTLDIGFTNLDSGSAQAFSFDYLWITVTYKPLPVTPTITAPSTPTNNTSQLLTGTKDKHATTINVICTSATVGVVTYPTPTSWQVLLTNLSQGNNSISVNAQNLAGSTGYVTTNIFVDSIAPSRPTFNSVPATVNTTTWLVTGNAEVNSIVKIYLGNTFIASQNAAGGNFSITVNGLVSGSNSINATATDALGNISATASSTIFVGAANVMISARWQEILVPTASGYTGDMSLAVPGSRIRYYTSIQNTGNITANSCTLRDVVPPQTHFYYTEPPIITGNVENIIYQGVTSNAAGPGSEVKFQFDIGPTSNATFRYTVTVD